MALSPFDPSIRNRKVISNNQLEPLPHSFVERLHTILTDGKSDKEQDSLSVGLSKGPNQRQIEENIESLRGNQKKLEEQIKSLENYEQVIRKARSDSNVLQVINEAHGTQSILSDVQLLLDLAKKDLPKDHKERDEIVRQLVFMKKQRDQIKQNALVMEKCHNILKENELKMLFEIQEQAKIQHKALENLMKQESLNYPLVTSGIKRSQSSAVEESLSSLELKNSIELVARKQANTYMEVFMDQSSKDKKKDPKECEAIIQKSSQDQDCLISFYNLIQARKDSIRDWIRKLFTTVQFSLDAYYAFLKDKKNLVVISEDERAALNEDERSLLEWAEAFDVEKLNCYKNITEEEKALLAMVGEDVTLSAQDNKDNKEDSKPAPKKSLSSINVASSVPTHSSSSSSCSSSSSNSTPNAPKNFARPNENASSCLTM